MKRIILRRIACVVALVASLAFPAFSQGADTQSYRLDAAASTLAWEGHKFFGGKHTGTIGLLDGTFHVSDGKLVGGEFRIDMNRIEVTDLQGETAAKLAAHLKTDDFFDAANHPVATFAISSVDYGGNNQAAIVGELTLRGITQTVVFLAAIDVEGGTLQATATDVRVDRTVHDAQYGSVRFFRDLGRKIVSDEFTLDIHVKATR